MASLSSNTSSSALTQLCQLTTVVADTGHLAAIKQFKPLDATTNPSLITAAALLPENFYLLEQAHAQATAEGLQLDAMIERMIDILTVKLGIEILKVIDGRVSTEVDASLSYDTDATITKAQELIQQYEAEGINKERVLIKIAATWQGIEAARILEQQGIHCNLTLLFGLHQAAACAEAQVTLISPFVGRILDWYKKAENRDSYPIEQDPGVLSVKTIYTYYKQHGYQTQIMGASFRSTAQILALAGCDLLTIAPALLQSLSEDTGTQLQPQLTVQQAQATTFTAKLELDQASFQQLLEKDLMSFELLQQGIDGFIKARQQLAQALRQSFAVPEIHA